MTPQIREHILKLVLDESDESHSHIYENIGLLDPDYLAMNTESRSSKIKAGRAWWSRHSQELKRLVCARDEIQGAATATANTLIDIIFPLLTIKYGEAISVFVAVQVIKVIAHPLGSGRVMV